MNVDALGYHLPPELIATRPAEPREDARLLVARVGEQSLEHRRIADLPEYLQAGDLLVRNDTAVLAARLIGRRKEGRPGRGGGRVEGLYLGEEDGAWLVLLTASGRLLEGERIELVGPAGRVGELELMARRGRAWLAGSAMPLEGLGHTPLPPYILKARSRREESVDDATDRAWYRTTFARPDHAGSVAAPTAGLHLTDPLRSMIRERGVREAAVTLHVGEGTFRPVTADRLEDHEMHGEAWSIDAEAAEVIGRGPQAGGRLIAVGTTTTRLLESLPDELPSGGSGGVTDLLIAPGWTFRRVDGLLTNFHLPRSTLLALVAAKTGLDFMHRIYAEAVAQRYRFYSYGDAMLILP
ncbi:MAG: tRNA preQ1(34) S-adenosylmethionine ribosyltransferase-isomerase QueA [Phycisphaerales bacterium]|nr:tRNA preQ1(34) S-adenosylmethionine ribosyltransferase-isomerase QueA [Phycisphaerales bacterium]